MGAVMSQISPSELSERADNAAEGQPWSKPGTTTLVSGSPMDTLDRPVEPEFGHTPARLG